MFIFFCCHRNHSLPFPPFRARCFLPSRSTFLGSVSHCTAGLGCGRTKADVFLQTAELHSSKEHEFQKPYGPVLGCRMIESSQKGCLSASWSHHLQCTGTSRAPSVLRAPSPDLGYLQGGGIHQNITDNYLTWFAYSMLHKISAVSIICCQYYLIIICFHATLNVHVFVIYP